MLVAWLHQIDASPQIPADNIQHKDEIIIFEVRHVSPQQIGLHFQLNIL